MAAWPRVSLGNFRYKKQKRDRCPIEMSEYEDVQDFCDMFSLSLCRCRLFAENRPSLDSFFFFDTLYMTKK